MRSLVFERYFARAFVRSVRSRHLRPVGLGNAWVTQD